MLCPVNDFPAGVLIFKPRLVLGLHADDGFHAEMRILCAFANDNCGDAVTVYAATICTARQFWGTAVQIDGSNCWGFHTHGPYTV